MTKVFCVLCFALASRLSPLA